MAEHWNLAYEFGGPLLTSIPAMGLPAITMYLAISPGFQISLGAGHDCFYPWCGNTFSFAAEGHCCQKKVYARITGCA
jgi:hypothetical protein